MLMFYLSSEDCLGEGKAEEEGGWTGRRGIATDESCGGSAVAQSQARVSTKEDTQIAQRWLVVVPDHPKLCQLLDAAALFWRRAQM